MWSLGNVHSIMFWLDNWLGIGPIRNFVQGPLLEFGFDMTVSAIGEGVYGS